MLVTPSSEKSGWPVGNLLHLRYEPLSTTRLRAFEMRDGLFEIMRSADPPPLTRVHVALRMKSKTDVDAFHSAALAAGARDNGPPGPRPEYTPNYYACFILDPDGYNIEAMIDEVA